MCVKVVIFLNSFLWTFFLCLEEFIHQHTKEQVLFIVFLRTSNCFNRSRRVVPSVSESLVVIFGADKSSGICGILHLVSFSRTSSGNKIQIRCQQNTPHHRNSWFRDHNLPYVVLCLLWGCLIKNTRTGGEGNQKSFENNARKEPNSMILLDKYRSMSSSTFN